jgi:hypothetical protein
LGRTAVITKTCIYRTFDQWADFNPKELSAILRRILVNSGYTEAMLERYYDGFNILESMHGYWSALKTAQMNVDRCPFLFLMYCVLWRGGQNGSKCERPEMTDFLDRMIQIAETSQYPHVDRFVRMRDELRRWKTEPGKKTGGTSTGACRPAGYGILHPIAARWATWWRTVMKEASMRYALGTADPEGIQNAAIARILYRNNGVKRNLSRYGKRLANRYGSRGFLRRLPIVGRLLARLHDGRKKAS